MPLNDGIECKFAIELTYNIFIAYIRFTGTKGVTGHFDLIHKGPLRMLHIEKFVAAQRIRLDKYALRPNAKYTL